jgi:hypothetical protein
LRLELAQRGGGHEVPVALLAVGILPALSSRVRYGRDTPRKSAASVVVSIGSVPDARPWTTLCRVLSVSGGRSIGIAVADDDGCRSIARGAQRRLELLVERGETLVSGLRHRRLLVIDIRNKCNDTDVFPQVSDMLWDHGAREGR